MPATIKRIRIFVASPGDVTDERKRLGEIVAHLRTHIAAAHGLDLELVRWETHVRPGVAADAQTVVNPQIGAYDLFIGILWNRFGTPTGRAESARVRSSIRPMPLATRSRQSSVGFVQSAIRCAKKQSEIRTFTIDRQALS